MRLHSGVLAFGFALAVFASPFSLFSATTSPTAEKEESVQGYKEIHTEELKKLIDSKKPVLIFDARPKLSGGLLPGAKQLAYNASSKTIEKAIAPHPKDAMIVVYCARKECPLSKYLAESLIKEGYTNVYKYPEGVEEWMQKYPVDKI